MANGGQGDEGSEEYVEWECGEWVVQKVRPVGSNLRVVREWGYLGSNLRVVREVGIVGKYFEGCQGGGDSWEVI